MVHANLLLSEGCFDVKSEEMAIRNGGHFEGEEEVLVGREAIRLIGGGMRDMDEHEEFDACLPERSHDQLGGALLSTFLLISLRSLRAGSPS
jgi:hypothetical protein